MSGGGGDTEKVVVVFFIVTRPERGEFGGEERPARGRVGAPLGAPALAALPVLPSLSALGSSFEPVCHSV